MQPLIYYIVAGVVTPHHTTFTFYTTSISPTCTIFFPLPPLPDPDPPHWRGGHHSQAPLPPCLGSTSVPFQNFGSDRSEYMCQWVHYSAEYEFKYPVTVNLATIWAVVKV